VADGQWVSRPGAGTDYSGSRTAIAHHGCLTGVLIAASPALVLALSTGGTGAFAGRRYRAPSSLQIAPGTAVGNRYAPNIERLDIGRLTTEEGQR